MVKESQGKVKDRARVGERKIEDSFTLLLANQKRISVAISNYVLSIE